MKLTYYQDPGHGWIATTNAMIQKLGIAGKISQYSYTDGDRVFLEEDLDAYHLVNALRATGEPIEIVESFSKTDSFIRRLPRFNKDSAQ